MQMFRKLSAGFLLLAVASFVSTPAAEAAGETLEIVKKRGHLKCGVSQGLPGFSTPDNRGNWTGIDVDFCKAVAAAIFNDADKVKFTPLSAKERFTAIQSGEVDIIARNTTWSMHRDTALGVDFPVINYYDGQGFMVRADLGVRSARDLDGATLCTNQGTTTELNAADYFRSNGMQYEIVAFEKADESVAAYNSGRCDAYTTDHSALYAQKLKLSDPKAHIVLPEVISKEPLGPLVRQGDAAWNDLVRWTHYATVAAENLA
jgi:ABC-type amino acid transport/signal transduction systems, periplasmic component/domain